MAAVEWLECGYKIDVLKKMCKITGWKLVQSKYSGDIDLFTDIKLPVNDDGRQLYLSMGWYSYSGSLVMKAYRYSSADPKFNKDSAFENVRINNRIVYYKCPVDNFDDIAKVNEYIEKLRTYFENKVIKRNKQLKDKAAEVNKANNSEFISSLRKLAEEANCEFIICDDEAKLYYNIEEIDGNNNLQIKQSKDAWIICWRYANFTYFECQTDQELYDMIKWILSRPNHATHVSAS